MRYIIKAALAIVFILMIITSLNNTKAYALEDNPYISKIHPISDQNSIIYFDTKTIDLNAHSLTFKYNGKSVTEDISWSPSNSLKQSVWLGEYLKPGTQIEVYLNYYPSDDEYTTISKLIDTLIVSDATPPSLKAGELTVRNTSFNIYTEKDATITASYNNKGIKLKKASSTKWIATIPKPLKGKKLIITAVDPSGNSNKLIKVTEIPNISFSAYSTAAVEKKIIGNIYGSKPSDKVYLKVGKKVYTGSIKGNSFYVKFGKVSTPKNVSLYVKDHFGNILASDTSRIYKYRDAVIGMTKSQVLNSPYGQPDNKSSDRYEKDFYEYWRYDYNDELVFLNFYNGKLQSISKYKN